MKKKLSKSFMLSAGTIAKIKKLCAESGHTQSGIIEILIEKVKLDDLKPFLDRQAINKEQGAKHREKLLRRKSDKAFTEKRAKKSADDFSRDIMTGELYRELKGIREPREPGKVLKFPKKKD